MIILHTLFILISIYITCLFFQQPIPSEYKMIIFLVTLTFLLSTYNKNLLKITLIIYPTITFIFGLICLYFMQFINNDLYMSLTVSTCTILYSLLLERLNTFFQKQI